MSGGPTRSTHERLHPVEHERAVIGSLLLDGRLLDAATLSSADFVVPDLGATYAAMLRSFKAGEPFDVLSLQGEPGVPDTANLGELLAETPSLSMFGQHCERVRDGARLRRLAVDAHQLAARVSGGELGADEAVSELSDLTLTHEQANPAHVPSYSLLDIDQLPPDTLTMDEWLIPGLLRRRGRAMLVAEEGVGKSVLTRQIGLAAAAGVHPFKTSRQIEPLRVLHVDLENSMPLVMNERDDDGRLRPTTVLAMRGLLQTRSDRGFSERWRFYSQEAGMNLRSAHDRRQLDALLKAHRPDLTIISPLYKAYHSQPHESAEAEASALQSIFDRLRVRFDTAFLFEHHAPKASGGSRPLHPFGSSLWQRWPDIGIQMSRQERSVQTMSLGRFRGDRYTTKWPPCLQRTRTPGTLPWVAYHPDGDVND